MWGKYSEQNKGVAIKSTIEKLSKSIKLQEGIKNILIQLL